MSSVNEKIIYLESYSAGADLSAKQYYGVKMSANRTVVLMAADTDVPAGVLVNDPASGETAAVCVVGRVPVVAGETLAAGNLVRLGSDGKGYVMDAGSDTTCYTAGQCTQGADAGEMAEVVVNCASVARGA